MAVVKIRFLAFSWFLILKEVILIPAFSIRPTSCFYYISIEQKLFSPKYANEHALCIHLRPFDRKA